ncbi:MAG: prephenate dehydratase, partial [Deltaproteobacteria bacterium]|nr:prephenate dehydratase [Deltaproteobacteria bacterium]
MKGQSLLAAKREQIEKIDNDIVQLLIRRADLARAIGVIKKEQGMDIYCAAQEEKIIDRILKKGGDALPPHFLETIFREIFSASRNLQKPFSIVTLGPQASFSYLAAKKYFGKSASLALAPDILAVFEEVQRGAADVGVVPAENSLEGVVNATMDAFVETSLNILGEYYFKISHSLLSQSQNAADITHICSHPQALAQCRNWLRANLPQATIVETESTSQAALIAKKEPHYGAITNESAAELYSLNKIASAIEDSAQNTTRFFIIGMQKSAPTGNDKTSLVLGARHIPGALHNILESFATRKINLTRLES